MTAWSRTFCFQNGLKDFVSWLEQDGEPLYTGIISGRHETDKVQAEFALVHNSSYSEQLLSFANNTRGRHPCDRFPPGAVQGSQ